MFEFLLSSLFTAKFSAGLENGASAMALTVWKLAKKPEIQEKLYHEIQEAIANNQNSMETGCDQHLNYNYLQNNMPYLEGNIMDMNS